MANGPTTPQDEDFYNRAADSYGSHLHAAEQAGTPNASNEGRQQEAISDQDDNSGSVRNKEQNPDEPVDNGFYRPSGQPETGKTSFKLKDLKKRGPMAAIITLLFGGTAGISFFLTGALAPIAFFENVTDDLNDQLAAMDVRSDASVRNKIPSSERNQVIAGCTKLTIRCKFKTMSSKQVQKYALAGITVTGDPVIAGRIAPTNYSYRGTDYTPRAFSDALNNDPTIRTAFKSALNMKFLGTSDTSFVGRTLRVLGIDKRPPELRGNSAERAQQLMNKTNVGNISEVNFSPADPAADGTPLWTLDNSDTPEKRYTQAERDKLTRDIKRNSRSKPPTRMQSNAIKALGVLGTADLACTVNQMIGGASVAAKMASHYQLAQYIMPLASLAHQAKAGDISVEDGEALGKFFGDTDNRQKIIDYNNAFNYDEASEQLSAKEEIPMIDNPHYGKNALDTNLYQLSSSGMLGSSSQINAQYSLGMSRGQLLASLGAFAGVASTLSQIPKGTCEVIQNWFVRGASLIAGISLGFFSFGGSVVVQAAAASGLFVASILLEAMINNAITGSVLGEDMEDAPVERGVAGWTGMAGILSEGAKHRGLMPATGADMAIYNQEQIKSKNDYIALEKANADPFDTMNQYSFMGSFARTLLPYADASNNVASTVGNIASLAATSFASALNPIPAHAAPIDQSRFKQCDDEGYAAIGIEPDVQCNVRYHMPAADLALDMDAVALYMEENGYVEPNTTTGLPKGYTPPVPEESQGFALDMLNGIKSSWYDDRNYGSEYGKYLDFCAYRVLPFGETFQEDQVNGVDPDWITGKKCLDKTDPMMSNFRIYTLDKTISEAEDGDAIVTPSGSASPALNSGGEGSGEVSADGWSQPTSSDANATVTQGFFPGTHDALDIAGAPGDEMPIYAVREGTVVSAGNIEPPYYPPVCRYPVNGTQQVVLLKHVVDGKTMYSSYHHLKPGSITVRAGDSVTAGQMIGNMGNSGCSGGVHLHFELWLGPVGTGTAIDPRSVFYK